MSGKGERDEEFEAACDWRHGGNGAANGFDGGFDDGEAEAGAPGVAGAGGVNPVEGIEEAGEAVFRDTGAVIGEFDLEVILGEGRHDIDWTARGVEEGITEEIAESTAQ